MENIRIEKIYLDINGNKTDEAHAVDVVIRQYSQQGALLQTSVERIVQKEPEANANGDQGSYTGKPPVDQGSYAFPDAGETWICPNDETENTGDVCVICGLSRPVAGEDRDHSGHSKKLLPIFGAVILGILLVLFAVWKLLPSYADNAIPNNSNPAQQGVDTISSEPAGEVKTVTADKQTMVTEAWKNNVLMSCPVNNEAFFEKYFNGRTTIYGWEIDEYKTCEPVFGSDIQRKNIRTVTFLDTTAEAPDSYWDVSEAGDSSVIAWVTNDGLFYDLFIAGEGGINGRTACADLFAGYNNLIAIYFNGCFHTEDTNSMRYMFQNCESLVELDVSSLITSNVRDMSSMFIGCSQLTELNLGTFDTSKVRDMSSMFNSCLELESVNVSGFDTSNVENMAAMFGWCESLSEVDVSGFDTSNVINMLNMFTRCKSLEFVDITGFDVSRVEDFEGFMDDGKLIGDKPWEEFFAVDKATDGFSESENVPMKFKVSDISIHVGYTYKLELLNGLSSGDVDWISSHAHIVSVTDEGVVKGEKEGTALITAAYGNQTATVLVRVIS